MAIREKLFKSYHNTLLSTGLSNAVEEAQQRVLKSYGTLDKGENGMLAFPKINLSVHGSAGTQ